MLQTQIRMSIVLGILALVGIALSFLALLDIAHGEPDTRLEWATVRATAAVMLMFIAQSLVTLVRARKALGTK
jgi:uncharacterized membrane protein